MQPDLSLCLPETAAVNVREKGKLDVEPGTTGRSRTDNPAE